MQVKRHKNEIYLRGVMTMNMSYVECLDMMLYFGERRKLWCVCVCAYACACVGLSFGVGGRERECKKRDRAGQEGQRGTQTRERSG